MANGDQRTFAPDIEAAVTGANLQPLKPEALLPQPPPVPNPVVQPAPAPAAPQDEFTGFEEVSPDEFAAFDEAPDEFGAFPEADVVDLSTPDQLLEDEEFNIIQFVKANPDALNDPVKGPKLVEAYRQQRLRGITAGVVPQAIAAAPEIGKKFVTGARDLVERLIDAGIQPAVNLLATIPEKDARVAFGTIAETKKQQKKAVAELVAGTETAAFGLADLIRTGKRKLVTSKEDLEGASEADLRTQLLDDVEFARQAENVVSGEGEAVTATGLNAAKLKKEGINIDPTVIEGLSLVDPLTLVAFGGGFKLVSAGGKLVATTKTAQQAANLASKIGAPLSKIKPTATAIKAAGATVAGAGKVAEAVGGVSKPILGTVGAVAGGVKGAQFGGLTGALVGAGAGSSAGVALGRGISRFGGGLKTLGGKITRGGQQVAGELPAGRTLKLIRAVKAPFKPVVTGATVGGVAAAPLAALADSDDQASQLLAGGIALGAGFGAAFGTAKGIAGLRERTFGRRLLDPFEGGQARVEPSADYGLTPEWDAVHKQQIGKMDERGQAAVNSARELFRGEGEIYAMDRESYVSRVKEMAEAEKGSPLTPEEIASIEAYGDTHAVFSAEFPTPEGAQRKVVFLNQDATGLPHDTGHLFEALLPDEVRAQIRDEVKRAYKPEELAALKEAYENQLNADVPEGSPRRLLSEEAVLTEVVADNFSQMFSNVDPATLGTPAPVTRRLTQVVANVAERAGIDLTGGRTTPGLPLRPAYSLQAMLENALRRRVKGQNEARAALEEVQQGEVPNKRVTPEEQQSVGTPEPETLNIEAAREFAAGQKDPNTLRVVNSIAANFQRKPGQVTPMEFKVLGAKEAEPGKPKGRLARLEERLAADVAEAAGAAPESVRSLFQDVSVPVRFEFVGKGAKRRLELLSMSLDKVLANVHLVTKNAKKLGKSNLIPYEIDPATGRMTQGAWDAFTKDLVNYAESQQNGYRGDGRRIVRPPDELGAAIPPENPNFNPTILPEDVGNFLNLIQGIAPPRTARVTGAGVPGNIKARRIAELQLRSVEPPARIRPRDVEKQTFPTGETVGEVNPLRQELARAGMEIRNLHEVTQRLRVDRIKDATPRADLQFKAPLTDVVRGGFLPPGNEAPVSRARRRTTIQDPVGELVFSVDKDFANFRRGDEVTRGQLEEAGFKIPKEQDPQKELIGFFQPEGEAPVSGARRRTSIQDPVGELVFKADKDFANFRKGDEITRLELEEAGFEVPAKQDPQKELIGFFLPDKNEAISRPPRTGREFDQFFTDVSAGTFGKSDKPFKPEMNLSGHEDVITAKEKHSGNFDDHIAKSIPTYYEAQIKKADAIARVLRDGGEVLDIAGSEGSFGKSISERSGGKVKTTTLDPNQQMKKFFEEKSQVEGAEFVDQAFLNGFDDVPAYNPTKRFDVVNESMGFQFIDPNRAAQIAEVKRLLKEDGIFITEEKVRNDQWAQNEAVKDSQHKNKYFSGDDLKAKDKRVGFAQSKNEQQSVGMVDNMATQAALEAELRKNFKHVIQHWDSGNFKGYIASDSLGKALEMARSVGDLNSKFSTLRTPRTLSEAQFLPKGGEKPVDVIDTKFSRRVTHAALRTDDGRIVTGNSHIEAYMKGMDDGIFKEGDPAIIEDGFVDADGNFLTRQEAFERAKETKQVAESADVEFAPGAGLESQRFAKEAKFLPKTPEELIPAVAKMGGAEFAAAMKAIPDGLTGEAVRLGNKVNPEQVELLRAMQEQASKESKEAMTAGDFDNAMSLATKTQFFREAVEVATKTGGFETLAKRTEGQFLPKKKKAPAKLPLAPKAFIDPAGEFVKVTRNTHDDFLIENAEEFNKQFGTKLPKTQGKKDVRVEAINKGFVRMVYEPNNGRLGVEANVKRWDKAKRDKLFEFVADNLDSIDNIDVTLFNDKGKVVKSDSSQLFLLDDDAAKLDAIPYVTKEQRGATSFLPKSQEELGIIAGVPKGDVKLGKAARGRLNRKQLKEFFPEAVVPRSAADKVDYGIIGSPRYKKAVKRGGEKAAVAEFADKLQEKFEAARDLPETELGRRWYEDFIPMLKARFGEDANIFAELLAATSPNTTPKVNFKFAKAAFDRWKAGEFDTLIEKYTEGLDKLSDGSLEKAYNRAVPKADRPANPSQATYMAWWIKKHNLSPRQRPRTVKGETIEPKFGMHSEAVLKVVTRRWLTENQGPKTLNFVGNLLGTSPEATIDLWAARSMREAGYRDFQERWRIMPENSKAVTDADFAFSQKVFAEAAKRLGMKPRELQGALWFIEKKQWADKGWSELDLGNYKTELQNLERLEATTEAQGDLF